MGVRKSSEPPHIVAIQEKIFNAGWHRNHHRGERKEILGALADASDEHVVRPNDRTDECNENQCPDHAEIAEDRFLAESRDNLTDDAERR